MNLIFRQRVDKTSFHFWGYPKTSFVSPATKAGVEAKMQDMDFYFGFDDVNGKQVFTRDLVRAEKVEGNVVTTFEGVVTFQEYTFGVFNGKEFRSFKDLEGYAISRIGISE